MTKQKAKNDEIQTKQSVKPKTEKTPQQPENFNSSLAALTSTISTLQSEVNFATHAFTGNVENVQKMMDSTDVSLKANLNQIEELLEQHEISLKDLQKQISILALLPIKTQETLRSLVPNITKEIENVHNKRMTSIESSLKELQKSLNKEAEKQLNVLTDLSVQFQTQLSDDVEVKHEMLVQAANNSIKQINKLQEEQNVVQKKIFQDFVDHTKKEIEAVTSNHGGKFLRNTAICLILATITGGISGWYINNYFPRFVSVKNTGDVRIHHSHVKVLENSSVKNEDLNTK
jgi:hypothetical protein